MNASENKDWRQKYADLVRSCELEEQQQQAQQQSLRRVILRLCLTVQGLSPQVDAELQRLKTLVAADTLASSELDAVGNALAEALLVHEKTPAALATATADATAGSNLAGTATRLHEAARRLLDELQRDPQLAESAAALQAELPAQTDPATWPALLARLGDLSLRRIRTLQSARAELQTLLDHLVTSLDQMAQFAAGDAAQFVRHAQERDSFASQVAGEVQALTLSLDHGSSLSDLRLQLGSRLASIAQQLAAYRQRESTMLQEVQDSNARMQARIAELEARAQGLQERLQQERKAATLDSLTGIPNRQAWDQRSVAELARWQRHPQATCVAAWDVDHFKAINDECGHAAGDRALRHVADCLRKHLRGSDFLARYGGEEFVMLLPDTSLDDAVALADRIRDAVTRIGFHVGGKRRPLSISCGVTILREGDDAATAFERADQALYQAKAAGRNRVCQAE